MYCFLFFFFFNDTATTEIYTLSLHDALPIGRGSPNTVPPPGPDWFWRPESPARKRTRLNSSHSQISYAGLCLKKKKKTSNHIQYQKKKKKKNKNIIISYTK